MNLEIRRAPRIATESVEKLYTQRNELERFRQPLVDRWRDVAEMFNPSMQTWDNQAPEVAVPNVKPLYDTTAIKASQLLPDGVQGYSFSRRDPWFRNVIDDERSMEMEPVAEWSQLFERHLYRQYNRSNFYDEGRLFVKMAADFGTGVMLARQNWKKGVVYFETLHPKDAIIDTDAFGAPSVLFHTLWLKADQAVLRWGYDSLPYQVQQAYDTNSRSFFRFEHVIMPIDQYNLDIEARAARGKNFYSLVVSDVDRYHPVHEGGFDVLPFFAWRWSRDLSGGPYGTDSPGLLEVSNAKQLNGMASDYARIVEQLARPSIKATDGLRGKINLKPHGVTYLPYGEDFTSALTVGNPQGLGEMMMLMKQGMKESYHVDFFLILTQAIEQQKTATEVAGIQGEKAALMASFFGRMGGEFLEPVHNYMVYSELSSGRFDVPPPPEIQGKELTPVLVSPLAMMQKRFLSLEPTKQALSEILPLAQLRPDILDNLDLDRFARVAAEDYNMDRRILLDIAEVEKIRQARAKAATEQAKIAEAQVAAQAQKDSTQAMLNTAEAKAVPQGQVRQMW